MKNYICDLCNEEYDEKLSYALYDKGSHETISTSLDAIGHGENSVRMAATFILGGTVKMCWTFGCRHVDPSDICPVCIKKIVNTGKLCDCRKLLGKR